MAEKKGGGKGIKSILMVVLIPIMIIVIVAGAFFAIIDGIINIIEGVVTGIYEFLKHPLQSTRIGIAKVDNFFAGLWGGGKFNPDEYLEHRVNPNVVINDKDFTTMKERLEAAVNLKATGLDDLMIKKLLVTYYRGVYLTDTNILIEITKEEKEIIDKENKKYWSTERGNKDKGIGEDGKFYLKVQGIVSIKPSIEIVAEPTDNYKIPTTLYYYPEEALKKIYEEEYKAHLNDLDSTYRDSIKKYLKTCYTYVETYNSDSDSYGTQMKMYAFKETTTLEEYKYSNDEEITGKLEQINSGEAELQTIDYGTDITQFLTPIEFFIDLMEISGSSEFIEAVLELISNEELIVLRVNEISNETKEITTSEYIQDTKVLGTRAVEYEARKKVIDQDGKITQTTDGLTIEENINEETKEISIIVKSDNNIDCEVCLYKNGTAIEYQEEKTIVRQGVTVVTQKRRTNI